MTTEKKAEGWIDDLVGALVRPDNRLSLSLER